MADFTLTIHYEVTCEFKARNEDEAQELADEVAGDIDVQIIPPKTGLPISAKAYKLIKSAELEQSDFEIEEH